MEDSLYIFQHDGFDRLRVLESSAGLWFVSKDVSNSFRDEWSGAECIHTVLYTWKSFRKLPNSNLPPLACLSPEGLIQYAGRSRKAITNAYLSWVFRIVIPSIQAKEVPKSVVYTTDDRKTYTATDFARLIGYTNAVAVNSKLESMNILCRSGNVLHVHSEYQDKDWFDMGPHKVKSGGYAFYPRFTEKGIKDIAYILTGKEVEIGNSKKL